MSTPAEIITAAIAPTWRRRGWSVLSVAAVLLAAVWTWNQLTVARPVKQAKALADAKRPIKHVVLARKGTAVFFMEGRDFLEIGRA
jgi:hypothetical protein